MCVGVFFSIETVRRKEALKWISLRRHIISTRKLKLSIWVVWAIQYSIYDLISQFVIGGTCIYRSVEIIKYTIENWPSKWSTNCTDAHLSVSQRQFQMIQTILFDCLECFRNSIYFHSHTPYNTHTHIHCALCTVNYIELIIDFDDWIRLYCALCAVLLCCHSPNKRFSFRFSFSIEFFRSGLLQVLFFVLLAANSISMEIVSLLLRTFN